MNRVALALAVLLAGAGPALGQSPADIVRPYPNDGIGSGLIVDRPAKELYAQEPFGQAVGVTGQRTLDDKLKKISAPFTARKTITGQNSRQLIQNRIYLLPGRRRCVR